MSVMAGKIIARHCSIPQERRREGTPAPGNGSSFGDGLPSARFCRRVYVHSRYNPPGSLDPASTVAEKLRLPSFGSASIMGWPCNRTGRSLQREWGALGSHSSASSANRVLLVGVSLVDNITTDRNVWGITFDGVSLTPTEGETINVLDEYIFLLE
jgi:hypothetical protein